MADPLVGSGFDLVGSRTQPGQTQTEFYNTQSGLAFQKPDDLSNFVNSQYGLNTTGDNVFSTLASGYRTQALSQIGDQLNKFQMDTFNATTDPAKRTSSSLTDSIAADQSSYDSSLNDYKSLQDKLAALTAPNFQQTYNDLRTSQGVPGLEGDFAANQKNIRELPYVNRMNSGNAGVMTEGQLGADTAQKGIPLEIQQGNLLDRLKLANDFITNSINLKQKDYTTSADALKSAADLVANTIGMTRQHLTDLLTQQKEQQDRQQLAQQFAFENRITKPFYDIGGTVFRTSDRMPAHNPQEYVSMGGTGDFSDVQKLSAPAKTVEVNPGNTLVDDSGKVIYQAPYTPSKYTSGGGTSSGTSGGSSGGASTKYTAPTATSEIMDEWSKGYIQGNGKISSTDYKKAKQWWESNGLSATSFDRQFNYLIDKSGNWQSDYGYGAS
jgi:hypothetical protein